MNKNEETELYHYGVKGQKWGVIREDETSDRRLIREDDSADYRLKSEKENLKYQYQNYEAKRFYDNQNEKDRLDYKRDVKIARFGKQIEKGKQYTDRAIQRNITMGQIYKYRALSTAAVAAALSASSIGNSYAIAKASGAGADTYITNDYRHHNTNTQSWTSTNSKNTMTSGQSKPKIKHSDLEVVGDTLVSDIVADDIIEHHGIKDMRWGVRRFQNKDGSLTEEGKLRYLGADTIKKQHIKNETSSSYEALEKQEGWKTLTREQQEKAKKEMDKMIKESAENEVALLKAKQKMMADQDSYAIATAETGKQVLEGTSKVFEQTSQLIPNVPGKSSHPDYSNLTTEELKKRTDRLNAEIAYAKASGQMKYTPSDEEKRREQLQTIGAVAGVLATVGSIIIPLVKLKHNRGVGGGD